AGVSLHPRTIRIPRIPAKPTWEIFESTGEVRELAKDGNHLPLGYMEQTAEIYGIDLRRTYTWLVQGWNKIERRNVLQLLAKSAALRGGLVTVVEPEETQWRGFAQSEGFEYLSGFEAFNEFFEKTFIPDFVSRNKVKQECLKKDYTEEEIYRRMAQEPARYLVITDLCQFAKMLHTDDRRVAEGRMKNLFEKGFLHNIYAIAGMNPDDRKDILDSTVFKAFTARREGIHLGGRINDQRIFEFPTMPFSEKTAPEKPGHGVTAPTETEDWHRIVLPIA
ncbi:MAG: hypothetical protein Q4D81_01250, partial [Eubacteriales bacterium]|nr:hypothetical protein [Eubacteriales bacterium]